VYDAHIQIADAVRKGELSEETLNAACLRVLEYKAKYVSTNLLSEKKAAKIVASKAHTKAIQDAADASITLLRNKSNLLPLRKIDPKARIAIVRPSFGRLMMSDNTNFYVHNMKEIFSQYFDNVSEYVFGLNPSDPEILGATDWAFMADYIVLCTYNAYQYPKQLELIQKCFSYAKNEKTILTVLRSPQDLVVIDDEIDTVLATYGVAECSIHALARTIAGINTPSGALPVGVGKDQGYKNNSLKAGSGQNGF
ncbi:MAG TPA: glycoside hydrolase family 3 C-terminal domain-containing protein, partial [Treponemataceae bacterium]|nr:glycoside hydrolase family 3 C-terminal domain-containing protein [Treponemataceae bacterium]